VRVRLATLQEGTQRISREFPSESLDLKDLDTEFLSPVCVQASVEKRSDQIFVTGSIAVDIECPCSRCLAPVKQRLEGPFTVFADRRRERESEEDMDALQKDRHMVFHDGESFEIGEELREALVLSIPSKVLCKKDCKGLCPTCGADLNNESCNCPTEATDSPWAVLSKLKKEDTEGD
jgi:uncharacterized protein